MFNPCILIPVYNHGPQLRHYLPQLLAYSVPIILINDGSNAETTDILDQMSAEHDLVTVEHLASNLGKGGAVSKGLLLSQMKGFTHALQIDADGQHNSDDIPQFLALAQSHPDRLISGKPVYDDSIPKRRLYGRYLTHFWIWVETLSFSIKDSMCGYRVYPLDATNELIKKDVLGDRMDFDPAIMVRLYWQGMQVQFVETKVLYPDDGLSHFDVLQDNILITLMHIHLVILMLLQLPKVLKNFSMGRRAFADPQDPNAKHWAQRKELGSQGGMQLMIRLYKLFGRRVADLILHPVILFFFLSGGSARKESQRFLHRVWQAKGQQGPEPSLKHSYQHFFAFGAAVLDRLGVWSGEMTREELVVHERGLVEKILGGQDSQSQGTVFLTSHLGTPDVVRGILHKYPRLKLTVLMFTDNAKEINAAMATVSEHSALRMIPVEKITPATAMMLNERVQQGECVAIAADRTPIAMGAAASDNDNIVMANFLGEQAGFPIGPFVLASLLACPVYTLFCVSDKGRYHFHLGEFSERIKLPRRKRETLLPIIVQQYADELAEYAKKYPYQWFNFYDFWQSYPPKDKH